MGESGMPRDERVRAGKGRYEKRVVTAAPDTTGATAAALGNGARVALIVTALFDTPVLGAAVNVSNEAGINAAPFGVLSPERASMIFLLSDYGDAVIRPIFIRAVSPLVSASVCEVIWHPED